MCKCLVRCLKRCLVSGRRYAVVVAPCVPIGRNCGWGTTKKIRPILPRDDAPEGSKIVSAIDTNFVQKSSSNH